MNCLQNLSRSYAVPPLQSFKQHENRPFSCSFNKLGMVSPADLHRDLTVNVKAVSGSASSNNVINTDGEDKKSELYSTNMTHAMGADLTYRHELGMNYNFICPDLIVGSCLQTPADVDKLQKIGVKTIFCLQQDPDLEYFGVDIKAIQEYTETCDDIQHIRARIRDFDAFDLRMRLPTVVGTLYNAINQNGGVTYIHCTAGLGRAPAVALAYMFWVQGYKLSEAHNLLMGKRPCFPKVDSIKSATADILTGLRKELVTLAWGDKNCSTVEISGLDIGWGQKLPLTFDKERGAWVLKKELPEGYYEYKYIIDGQWRCNEHEPLTWMNKDGHINNYVKINENDSNSDNAAVRNRLTVDDPELTEDDRIKIRQFLESCPDEDVN